MAGLDRSRLSESIWKDLGPILFKLKIIFLRRHGMSQATLLLTKTPIKPHWIPMHPDGSSYLNFLEIMSPKDRIKDV